MIFFPKYNECLSWSPPHIPLETTNNLAFIPFLIFLIVGVPGNLLILTVNRRQAVKTGTLVFFSALAVTDLAVCTLRLVDAICTFADGEPGSDLWPPSLEESVMNLHFGLILLSAFATVTIAYNRRHAVCKPHSRRISPKKAKLVSVTCAIIALFTMSIVGVTENVNENCYVWACINIVPVSLYIISMVMVLVLYGKILHFLRGRKRILAWHNDDEFEQHEIATLSDNCSAVIQGQANNCDDTNIDNKFLPAETSASLQQQKPSACPHQGQEPSVHPQQKPSTSAKQQEPLALPLPQWQKSSTRPLRQDVCHQHQKPSARPQKRESPARLKRQQKPLARPKRLQTNGRTTVKLILVTVSFFVLSLPFICFYIMLIIQIFKEDGRNTRTPIPKMAFLKHLVFFKSVLNPFIYGLVDRRFRAKCKGVFRSLKCCHRNR